MPISINTHFVTINALSKTGGAKNVQPPSQMIQNIKQYKNKILVNRNGTIKIPTTIKQNS